jgi:recombination associated protein RdgC
MWFRNLQIYRLPKTGASPDTLQEKLAARPFQPCGSQDMASRGWSSPTKDDRFVLAVAATHRAGRRAEAAALVGGQ